MKFNKLGLGIWLSDQMVAVAVLAVALVDFWGGFWVLWQHPSNHRWTRQMLFELNARSLCVKQNTKKKQKKSVNKIKLKSESPLCCCLFFWSDESHKNTSDICSRSKTSDKPNKHLKVRVCVLLFAMPV